MLQSHFIKRSNSSETILKRTRSGSFSSAQALLFHSKSWSTSISSWAAGMSPLPNSHAVSRIRQISCNHGLPAKIQWRRQSDVRTVSNVAGIHSISSNLQPNNNRQQQQPHHCYSTTPYHQQSSIAGAAGASRNESYEQALAALPKDAQLQFDFFGEPVTFLGLQHGDKTSNAMAALDGFVLAVATKGRTCTGGGAEEGLEMKSAHASAIAWAELLRHAKVWNPTNSREKNDDNDDKSATNDTNSTSPNPSDKIDNHSDNTSDDSSENNDNDNNESDSRTSIQKFAPMLAVAAIAPVMAQAGFGYVQFLDRLLQHGDSLVPGMGPLQMIPLAQAVIDRKDDPTLNERERQHIQALEYMMHYDHQTALWMYLKILRTCPGDVLALSLAIDLANVLGDKQMALKAATSVSSYWNERQGGFIQPAIPGYNIACSWQAVGLAVGGRRYEAEQIAERNLGKDKRNTGAVTTWALAHIYDAEGRVSEGISFLANHDGIANYEGCGLLFFDCRLSGYGALFSIDREQRGRGLSGALRLYDRNFERILEYSGFSQGKAWARPQRRAPFAWVARDNDGERSKTANFFRNLLGSGKDEAAKRSENETQIVVRENLPPSLDFDQFDPSCEDVLTWLPPTPPLLTEATLLMFKLTLNGTLSTKDHRWDSLRNSWRTLLELQKDEHGNPKTLEHFPLACMAASLLLPAEETGGDHIGNGRMASGLHLLGEMLDLGNQGLDEEEEETKDLQVVVADREPDFWLPAKEEIRKEWKEIVDQLASALDGIDSHQGDNEPERAWRSLRFEPWDLESRPIMEHALCYAACRAGDTDSLSYARAICSQGVTLRPSSPEEWWRYSIILGLLGDQVASENALATAVNVGSGQGQRG